MSDSKVDLRRRYIEGAVREAVGEMNRYFQQEGVTTTIGEEDLGRIRLSFDSSEEPDTAENLFCILEDFPKVNPYLIGKNAGRVFVRYFNPTLAQRYTTGEATKISLVIYHLFGILHVRNQDPEADVDSFPEAYESARETFGWSSLRETKREQMERLTGQPIDLPTDPQTDDDTWRKKDYFKQEEQALPPEDLDDFVDPEEDARREARERRKEAEKWDPNQGTDFGYGFEVGDLGHEGDERDELVRREVDSVKYDGLAADRQANMSEEFQAARTIYHGRRDSADNWRTVLANLLTSPEEDSIRYLKGIFNY